MKRLLVRLLSFLLMLVMIASVVCRTSESFPTVQKITKITSRCTENGAWEVDKSNKKLIEIPYVGKVMESIAEPKGFIICLAVYLILLFIGRKKNTLRKESPSEVYRYSDYYGCDYESLAEVSEAEAVSDDDTASVAEISLPETS